MSRINIPTILNMILMFFLMIYMLALTMIFLISTIEKRRMGRGGKK